MNNKAKRRLVVTGGIVAIAMLVIVAVAGAGGSAASITVGDVLSGGYEGKKVQVSGAVVADSIDNDGTLVSFGIAPEGDPAVEGGAGAGTDGVLTVTYDGALPATFGTGVVAICTGTVEDGALAATEMVTKCPSKYESAEGSLTVKGLLDQADEMTGVTTKVCGYVRGQVAGADAEVRFTLESQGEQIGVVYDGGLPEGIASGTALVVEGSLGEDGLFHASAQPAIDSAVAA